MNRKVIWGLIALVFSLSMTSCEKTDGKLDNVDTSMTIPAVQDKAIADFYWNMIDADIDIAGNILESKNYKSVTDSCPNIMVEFSTDSIFPSIIDILTLKSLSNKTR